MKILITGATGLIGQELSKYLETQGHTIYSLTRGKGGDHAIHWDPEAEQINRPAIEGFDAVVHLAGENIAEGRWTKAKKQRILDSRVDGTEFLCNVLANLVNPPKVLISSSAIGWYGSRGDELLTEKSGPGEGFLADVCKQWEAATEKAKKAGIRVVNLRTGVVLSNKGGALAKMLLPFKLGAGGVIGNGKQWMSWIGLEDLVRMIEFAITNQTVSGPLNGVAPGAVTNREFTKTLGKVLHRPTIFPMPAFVARIAFGEMADALLLSSSKVVPKTATENGFKFRWNRLEDCLEAII